MKLGDVTLLIAVMGALATLVHRVGDTVRTARGYVDRHG